MSPNPEVWNVFPTFRMWPGITFFGLDKSKAHCLTVPAKENTSAYIEYFGLDRDNLQTKIWFLIYGIEYPAEVRLIRQKSGRKVIQFQWKKWTITKNIFSEHLDQAYDSLTTEGTNSEHTVIFHHLGKNVFFIRFGQYDRIQHRRDFDNVE